MKTDRELLELAAKAAGIEGKYSEWTEMGELHYKGFRQGAWGCWNPITDDGDALRLAVALDIHISLYGRDTGLTIWLMHSDALTFHADYGDDPCQSVRRAITRAAAAIGASMP